MNDSRISSSIRRGTTRSRCVGVRIAICRGAGRARNAGDQIRRFFGAAQRPRGGPAARPRRSGTEAAQRWRHAYVRRLSESYLPPAILIQRVVLLGFMASGKSSVGEALARRLEWEFLDFDVEI